MKNKILILLAATAFPIFSYSQEEENNAYSRWSVEINAGQNKPVRPFSSGYYTSKPNTYFYFNGIEHYDIGVRYMFSNIFGTKLDFGFDEIKSQNGSGSLEFNNRQYRIGLQGVANLGRIMKFESFTSRIGLLGHAGIQAARFEPQMGINQNLSEDNGGIIFGLTPQFRITNWLAFTGDFTVISNVRQHMNWDGTTSADNNNLGGVMYNTSIGITYYPGSNKDKKHADWYVPGNSPSKSDAETQKRITALENLIKDINKGETPGSLYKGDGDSGVAVDSRGKTTELTKNVNDETERHTNAGKDGQATSANIVKSFVESGSFNIFYDLNKDMPNSGSITAVYQILKYLRENPEVKITLMGYADYRGSVSYNKQLSRARVLKLKNLYTANGISGDRILIEPVGIDNSLSTDSKTSLDLARRVSIKLTN